jgi:preprotein translocase subunit YajC
MIGGVVLVMVLMVVPQWQAKRRQKKQMEAIDVGTEVMTVGGIIGKITHIDREENRARIEIAPGVEMQILVNAINRPLTPEVEEEAETSSDDLSEE